MEEYYCSGPSLSTLSSHNESVYALSLFLSISHCLLSGVGTKTEFRVGSFLSFHFSSRALTSNHLMYIVVIGVDPTVVASGDFEKKIYFGMWASCCEVARRADLHELTLGVMCTRCGVA